MMNPSELNRRNFHKLAGAALGGLMAGAAGVGFVAAAEEEEAKPKDPKKPLLLQEPHICRGLNVCKGHSVDKKNDCAGMGACGTVKDHKCKGMNDCAGLGGCGEHPGENTCKGMGECAVPLSDKAWTKARANFEAAMKKADKK